MKSASGVQAGLTVIEIIIGLALVGALTVIAVPGLAAWQATLRVRTEINALHHAFHVARRASITGNVDVVVCPSTDGQQCRGDGDWSSGWLVYVESSGSAPPQRDHGERRLLAFRGSTSLRSVANRRYFVVRTRRYRATNGTFVICDRLGRGQARALIVSYTGRPRARPAAEVAGRLPCR
ncbi:MAG: GspH/FimT family pseudopilin [Pseudomonadota bacterium]